MIVAVDESTALVLPPRFRIIMIMTMIMIINMITKRIIIMNYYEQIIAIDKSAALALRPRSFIMIMVIMMLMIMLIKMMIIDKII